jgi:Iron-containing redox enzyme
MLASIGIGTPFILQVLFIAVFALAFIQVKGTGAIRFLKDGARRRKDEFLRGPTSKISYAEGDTTTRTMPEGGRGVDEMQLHKDLYFKLQNLERYPEILPQSRDLLISLFSEILEDARKKPKSGIFSIEHYTREGLVNFMKNENYKTTGQWEKYLARREAGWPREMFKDREEANWWLKQYAPVKYVDGAWLGHINKITTPFALRRVTKDAWQILSEELGDGDLNKNHVNVYHELMKGIEPGLPEGDTADFIHPRHGLNEPQVWKGAVAQLLVSLFPHEFLPEVLGFNMHYEGLTLETMKATKELQELKLNAYYFLLHISIDNADSGHTAIAMEVVIRYIDHIQKTQGIHAAQQAWKRVQIGFLLSEVLVTSPVSPSLKESVIDSFPRNVHEAEMIKILEAKASVAHKIHCGSRMKIGRRTLVDWLEPGAFASKQWQMDFLNDLSNTKLWVCKGESSKSKIIQELSWGGRMFGSFTQNEVEVVERWIDSLGNPDPRLYWSFAGQSETTSDQVFQDQDIRTDYPVISRIPFSRLQLMHSSTTPLPALSSIKTTESTNTSKLLPLWFTHPCLLESLICIPAKTTTKTACSIIRFLRAQSGFGIESPGVAGMDEVRRTECIGLVELGLEMTKKFGLPMPGSLKDVLENWPSKFAVEMLHLSMRPIENAGILLGLANAFVSLHRALAASSLLLDASREALEQMARREQDCLDICLEELKQDKLKYAEFCTGHALGIEQIEACFG